jgi:YggT family protein
VRSILCQLLSIYLLVVFGRIILSWFPITPGSALASVYRILHALTEPVLAPVRRILPPVGMGGMGLDLSPIIVTFGIFILQNALCH